MNMIKRSYTVRFLTPAFLGDAEQIGAWRAPPFKALLRQWWRVAVAADFNYDHRRIREIEGALFGNAWIRSGDSLGLNKSLLRIRLDAAIGAEAGWPSGTQVGVDPERESPEMKYVAWGLIARGPTVPNRTAIKDVRTRRLEGERVLHLAFPGKHTLLNDYEPEKDLALAMSMIEHFGATGSRCRNGWGSIALIGIKDQPRLLTLNETIATSGTQLLDAALNQSWASCIGRDKIGPFVWESRRTFDSWGRTLLDIAATKKHVRSNLVLDRTHFSERHILGLPVKDSDPLSNKDIRMPSPLRFKVFEREKKLAFRVYATPHGLPDAVGLDIEHPASKGGVGVPRRVFLDVAQKSWPKIARLLSEEASGVTRVSA
jgi:CRISPR-associated protein Cmr1